MKTLTQNELTEVAGGWGPSVHGGYKGYEYGTSGNYVYEQYYRESLSFDFHTYGKNYYGGYSYPSHGCGKGCGY